MKATNNDILLSDYVLQLFCMICQILMLAAAPISNDYVRWLSLMQIWLLFIEYLDQ